MPFKPNEREYRAFLGGFDFEEKSDEKKLILRGTPIVFDTETVLWEYDGIEYKEIIDRGALDEADMSDFILNVDHSGTPYARNKNGSLKYRFGENFEIEATLDAESERDRQLYKDVKSGLLDKMSFAFTIRESSYDEQTHTRRICKIKRLYDVSVVTFPAYNDTTVSARSFFEAERLREAQALELERRRRLLYLRTLT